MQNPEHSRARIYQCFQNQCTSYYWNWTQINVFNGVPYMGDYLLFSGMGGAYPAIVSPPLALAKYTTLSVGEQDYFGVNEIHYTPRPEKMGYDRGADGRDYGSLLTSLKSIAPSRAQPRELIAQMKEKGVLHFALNGDVFDADLISRVHASSVYPLSGDVSWPYDVYNTGTHCCNKFVTQFNPSNPGSDLIAEDGFYVDPANNGPTNDLFKTAAYVDYARPYEVHFQAVPGFTMYYTWGDINIGEWTSNSDGSISRTFHATYQYRIALNIALVYYWDFDVTRDLTFNITPNQVGHLGQLRVADCFTVIDNSSVVPLSQSPRVISDIGGLAPFYDLTRFNYPVKISKDGFPALESSIAQPSSLFSANFTKFRFNEPLGGVDRYRTLRSLFLEEINEIRPSGFLAAKDALQTNVSAYSFNLLQDLQHLQDIANVLPDLAELGRLCADAVKGDLSVIPRIIDYFTESVLKYNFEQRPLVKDGREILSTDLLNSIRAITQFRDFTWYGQFDYTFQPSENFMKVGVLRLETKVKLRGSVDLTSFLASVFALNGAGALPTLSRVWSLIPFSFVVDWFTNESERLRSVDSQFLFLALNTYWCLYSYKLFWYPGDEELGRYSLATSLEKPFHYTAYLRELSRLMPRLTDSRYDFQRRTSGPDPVTVGSLMWQLL